HVVRRCRAEPSQMPTGPARTASSGDRLRDQRLRSLGLRHNDRGTKTAWPGSHQPLGATWGPQSTNFAVFAPEANGVELCLFDEVDGADTETRYVLTERTLGIWHGALPDIEPGQRY